MNNLKLTGRKPGEARSVIEVGGVRVGEEFVVIAGPCSVESEDQTIRTAVAVKEAGAKMLRGGAFKPRTSPYAFQGLGLKGLKILDKAKRETGLPIVTEVVDTRDVSWVGEYADLLQIGARNMQNFSLLARGGQVGQAHPAQARHVLHPRGVAQLRRVHPRRGQRQGHPLRAGHPHLRDLHAQHPRPQHGPRGPRREPPAHPRRPLARHRASCT